MFNEFMKKYFMPQKMMRTVLISLIPIVVASIYYFGWRSLFLLIVVTIAGVLTEHIYEKKQGKKATESVLVSCFLYTLVLPVATPYWIAALGIIFGIFFGKAVFGGFGRNVFNPALVARAFVYVNFPEPLTIVWNKAASGFPGGFGAYITQGIDLVSQATPMLIFRDTGEMLSPLELLFGGVAGSLGETSKILIIIAGIYLIYKKVASWEIMAGVTLGFLSLTTILYLSGQASVPNPIYGIITGGFLFGTVFMATDPISAPKTRVAKWIYGILIGIVTVIIRGFALFAGGMMFAILIGNTFAPIIDEGVKYYNKIRKESKEGAKA